MKHDPNCAVVRGGDLRAWCDCGAEIPVLNEIRANVSETIGAGKERAAIVRWLRKAANGFYENGDIYDGWCAEAIDTVADEIEAGEHNSED